MCARVGCTAVEVAVLMSKTELGSRDASQRCHRGMGGLSENVGTPTENPRFYSQSLLVHKKIIVCWLWLLFIYSKKNRIKL